MSIEDLLKAKREEILKIAAKHSARNIRIFGSVARREADSESDLDILVEFLPGSTLLSQSAMIRELESLLGVKRCGGGPRCKQAGHVPAAAKLIEFKQTHLLKSFFFFRCSLHFDIIANYVR